MEIAAPEMAEVQGGKKSFKSAAQSVRRQTSWKQFGTGSKQTRVNPTKSTKRASR